MVRYSEIFFLISLLPKIVFKLSLAHVRCSLLLGFGLVSCSFLWLHLLFLSTNGGSRSIGVEIVNEHGWVFHHALCCKHEPRFHGVHEAVRGTPHVVVHIVPVVAVGTTALISKLARDFRVHE